MIKTTDSLIARDTRSPADVRTAASRPARSPLGVVHCFVEGDELRRLIANMAAVELLTVIIQSRV